MLLEARSVDQNAKLHALCRDIAKQVPWAGQHRSTEDWKRLLVDAWERATDRLPGRVVPSLDGSGIVVLNRSTRKMSKADMSELIEFVTAWAVDQGVQIGD